MHSPKIRLCLRGRFPIFPALVAGWLTLRLNTAGCHIFGRSQTVGYHIFGKSQSVGYLSFC